LHALAAHGPSDLRGRCPVPLRCFDVAFQRLCVALQYEYEPGTQAIDLVIPAR
jgi:hypothetical protein